MAVVCQKICIVLAAILGLFAGIAVLGLGIFARITVLAAEVGVHLTGGADEAAKAAHYTAQVITIVLLTLGSVIIIANFLGCYGALCDSLCMTYTYFGLQILLTLVSVTVAILMFVGHETFAAWLRDEKDCNLCVSILNLVSFAYPIGGIFTFAAAIQALTVYCAWVVAQKIKEGTIGGRGGQVLYSVPQSTTTVVVTNTR